MKIITIIIPTLNRPQKVLETLIFYDSFRYNLFKLHAIVVESGNFEELKFLIGKQKFNSLSVNLNHSPVKSSAYQRTLGLQSVDQTDWVIFTDDDIRFSKIKFEQFLSIYENIEDKTKTGAAPCLSGLTLNNSPGIYTRFFYRILSGKKIKVIKDISGKFLPPGINIAPAIQSGIHKVDWFMSGFMLFEYSKIKNCSFDDFFKGYSVFEDLDFTFGISKNIGTLYAIPIQFIHLEEGYESRDWYSAEKMRIINRHYVGRKYFGNIRSFEVKFIFYQLFFGVIPLILHLKYNHLKGLISGFISIYKKA